MSAARVLGVYLVDTNVVSELRRPRPQGAVVAWLDSVPWPSLRISAVTLGEIQRGIEIARARDPAKAEAIEAWANNLEATFAVIPVDSAIFRRHAQLRHARRSLPYEDALIAATARVLDLTVVTRDVADCQGLALRVVDPFRYA